MAGLLRGFTSYTLQHNVGTMILQVDNCRLLINDAHDWIKDDFFFFITSSHLPEYLKDSFSFHAPYSMVLYKQTLCEHSMVPIRMSCDVVLSPFYSRRIGIKLAASHKNFDKPN